MPGAAGGPSSRRLPETHSQKPVAVQLTLRLISYKGIEAQKLQEGEFYKNCLHHKVALRCRLYSSNPCKSKTTPWGLCTNSCS
eukprot:5121053-Pleurochrysis_carterae.AAC.1